MYTFYQRQISKNLTGGKRELYLNLFNRILILSIVFRYITRHNNQTHQVPGARVNLVINFYRGFIL